MPLCLDGKELSKLSPKIRQFSFGWDVNTGDYDCEGGKGVTLRRQLGLSATDSSIGTSLTPLENIKKIIYS